MMPISRMFFAGTILLLLALPLAAQDPVKVAPGQCTVESENDHVRILRWKIGPGEKTPMHEHPRSVTVMLSDGKAKFTLSDGTSRELDGKAGQVSWSEAEKHSSVNLGDTGLEAIQIELKGK